MRTPPVLTMRTPPVLIVTALAVVAVFTPLAALAGRSALVDPGSAVADGAEIRPSGPSPMSAAGAPAAGPRAPGPLAFRAPARLRPPADGSAAGDRPLPDSTTDLPIGPALDAAVRDAEAEARALSNERAVMSGRGAQRDRAGDSEVGGGQFRDRPAGASLAAAEAFTAAALVLPVEFGASEELTYQVHNADGSACITVTNRFTGPLHGRIPYPGGSPSATIDNQTVYYPSTEPEDYARLIFGRSGYTAPVRAGDPNVNDGAGVDISGLTVQSYFDAQSDGTVHITGTVAPWIELPRSEAYYGIDYCVPGLSPRAIPDEQLGSLAELTADAAAALVAQGGRYASRDFWEALDRDGDLYVDGVWVIHAGRGQEYGGGTEGEQAIWSRASALSFSEDYPDGFTVHDGGTPGDPSDDLRIDAFTMLPEDSDLGVLVEEFGHSAFGVPDLYTNDAPNSVGWWAPMSSGIWGGELGGTRPVNMPLWFRTVADCAGSPCGWADPVAVVPHTTAGETIVIGRAGEPAGGVVEGGPYAGRTIHEGVRIDLPDQVETVPNRAGEGGGAYSGAQTGRQLTLTTAPIDLSGISGPLTLTVGAAWSIPTYWGYAFVEVAVFDGPFQSIPDLDGYLTDDDPFGLNTGDGLTGSGEGLMRFDLSDFAGSEITVRFRYITYRGGPGTGIWIDDLVLAGDAGTPIVSERFDAGLPSGWSGDGWIAVPLTLTHPHHYLIEWRDDSGFDASLRGAYQTSFRDADEWRVDRVAANVPGALVMYRNLKYPFSGNLLNQNAHLPSWGPKYALLVVDHNSMPTRRPSGQPFSGALESLDAALAFQPQPDFSLEIRDPATGALVATEAMSGSPATRLFDDAFGATPGIRRDFSDPASPETSPWDADASVVLPSRDGRRYSTRLTDASGEPLLSAYGEAYAGEHVFGTGDPGDDNAQIGLHVELVDMAEDGRWGAIHISNRAVDYRLQVAAESIAPGDPVDYSVVVDNVGALPATVAITVEVGYVVDGEVVPDHAPSIGRDVPAGRRLEEGFSFTTDPESPATAVVMTARFDDGDDVWERRHAIRIAVPAINYLPAVVRAAEIGGAGAEIGGAGGAGGGATGSIRGSTSALSLASSPTRRAGRDPGSWTHPPARPRAE